MERLLTRFGIGLKSANEQKLVKNIAGSIFYKGGNIIIQLILVRVTLAYLSVESYGFWLVLSSLLTWFNVFDLGFVNGLRNKLTQAIADENYVLARQYISTTYAIITSIFTGIFLISLAFNPFVDWQVVFNVRFLPASEVTIVTILTFGFFCFRLALLPINAVLFATHQAAKTELLNFLINLGTLGVLVLVGETTDLISLIIVSIIYGFVPIVVLLLFTYYIFSCHLRTISPSIKSIRLVILKELGGAGGAFFVLQLISLLFFSTQQFIIAQLFNTTQVTVYGVAYRYLSLVIILSNVMIAPYWSTIAEAVHKQNFSWIRAAVKSMLSLWYMIVFLTVLMVVGANIFYKIWLGNTAPEIPFGLTVIMAFSLVIMAWNSLYSTVLNAFGAIRLQIIIASTMAILSIPMAVYFAKTLHLGLIGISLSMVICMIPGMILQPLQYRNLIQRHSERTN